MASFTKLDFGSVQANKNGTRELMCDLDDRAGLSAHFTPCPSCPSCPRGAAEPALEPENVHTSDREEHRLHGDFESHKILLRTHSSQAWVGLPRLPMGTRTSVRRAGQVLACRRAPSPRLKRLPQKGHDLRRAKSHSTAVVEESFALCRKWEVVVSFEGFDLTEDI